MSTAYASIMHGADSKLTEEKFSKINKSTSDLETGYRSAGYLRKGEENKRNMHSANPYIGSSHRHVHSQFISH